MRKLRDSADAMVVRMSDISERNTLKWHMIALWGSKRTEEVLQRYAVDTSDTEKVRFPYYLGGMETAASVIRYHSDLTEKGRSFSGIKDYGCFGARLLEQDKSCDKVFITKHELSAVLGSLMYPGAIWIATGSKSVAPIIRIHHLLEGRKIVLLRPLVNTQKLVSVLGQPAKNLGEFDLITYAYDVETLLPPSYRESTVTEVVDGVKSKLADKPLYCHLVNQRYWVRHVLQPELQLRQIYCNRQKEFDRVMSVRNILIQKYNQCNRTLI